MKPISANPSDRPIISGPVTDSPLTIAPGRDFSFSAWRDEEFAVVFDGNSGDFWIVSVAARSVLSLLRQAPAARRDIIDSLCADRGLSIDEQDSATVVDGLLSQKLIVAISA